MRPGPGLVPLLLALLALGVAAGFWAPLHVVWLAGAAFVVVQSIASMATLRRAAVPAIEREVAGLLPLGVFSPVTLRLTNAGSRPARVEVFDGYPATAELDGQPREVVVPPRSTIEVDYRIRPRRRGLASFAPTEVLLRGPGDLFRRRVEAGRGQTVRVVPNVRAVARFALLAQQDQLGNAGVRLGVKRGEGMEFDELREYRQGDSLRRIDWKATSRRNQLISRQYREERNQQVMFLVDCGRRMRAQDGDLTHFDHVLNSILLLTYVALRQGDAVGFLTFSGERRWLPPVKGPSGMASVLRALYDLDTTTEPSDYLEGATRLMARQRRRALVVLVTNLRDEDSAEIQQAVRLLATRHLVLLASLREGVLEEALAQKVETLDDALLVSSTHRYLAARRAVIDRVRTSAVLTLDVPPPDLPLKIVNRYLDVKRGGLL